MDKCHMLDLDVIWMSLARLNTVSPQVSYHKCTLVFPVTQVSQTIVWAHQSDLPVRPQSPDCLGSLDHATEYEE